VPSEDDLEREAYKRARAKELQGTHYHRRLIQDGVHGRDVAHKHDPQCKSNAKQVDTPGSTPDHRFISDLLGSWV